MKQLLQISLLILTTSIVLSSCSNSRSATQTTLTITSLDWRLVSVKSNDNSKELKPTDILPTLSVKEGKATGNTGCNSFSGPVSIEGHSLKFGDMVMTRKFCPNSSEIENAIIHVFTNTDNYTIENGDLLLKKGEAVLATYSSFR